MSFPPVTEMFQFTGFASRGYGFTARYRRSGGFPHSEIPGSKPARGSPGLIATCYVLHRLSVPRHPPNALLALEPRDSHAQTQARAGPAISARRTVAHPLTGAARSNARPLHDVKQPRRRSGERVRRSPRARRSVPAECAGGGERNRTDDLLLAKQALSRLSYAPARGPAGLRVVGLGRLELPTSRLSGVRSDRLSYRPPGAGAPGPARGRAPRLAPGKGFADGGRRGASRPRPVRANADTLRPVSRFAPPRGSRRPAGVP